jgi:hypothetical protein
MTKNLEQFTAENKLNIFLITYPQASIKDVQARGKAFNPQKRTSRHFKTRFLTFLNF